MKIAYPVFIKQDKNDYLVYIPDVNGFTEGHSFCDAIDMARDYICGAVVSSKNKDLVVPKASSAAEASTKAHDISEEDFDFSTGTLTYVDVDFESYRKKVRNLSVKKNCTIPQWLSEKAEAEGINFSKVLQDALINLVG